MSEGATLNINPFSTICRGCLSEDGEMKNMYEWGLSDDFYKLADIPDTRTEGVSELLCLACEESLRHFCTFRARCQRSDQLLRDAVCTRKEEADSIPLTHNIEVSTFADHLIISITTEDMTHKIFLPCPYNCQRQYLKQKDLMTHLLKSHSISADFRITVRYYCPHEGCHYHKESSRKKYFQSRKYLNQHLNKVHKAKYCVCVTCKAHFSTESEYQRHSKTCSITYICAVCDKSYENNERLLVHLKRKHPQLHQDYKNQRKNDRNYLKRVSEAEVKDVKKPKSDIKDYICDSPKRSFATQTLLADNIKNDVTLAWTKGFDKSEEDRNFSTIETQTMFEDMLSLKSQNSEDSFFFAETVSLSDIQTQTFPLEFGLSRKETITSETQTKISTPVLSMKETQTCVCHYDSPKLSFKFESTGSSPSNASMTAETQTPDFCKTPVKSDVMLGFSSAETQTCFEDGKKSVS